MSIDFSNLKQTVQTLFEKGAVQNLAIRVGVYDELLFEEYRSVDSRLNSRTLFDMASVTKILSTTMLSLIAFDRGLFRLEDRAASFFPEYPCRSDATVQDLLTHRCGVGHLLVPDLCAAPEDGIAGILAALPSGGPFDVQYSCPAFILLGRILEKLFGMRLDRCFRELVTEPLGMHMTTYCPDRRQKFVNNNAGILDLGIVADENCRWLGGIEGNAGAFSNMEDLTVFVKMLLAHGAPLVSRPLFDKAIQNHTPGCSQSRGLGFRMADELEPQAAGLFPNGFGHCGHTGQSVYLSPDTGLWVIILSDATAMTQRRTPKGAYSEVMQMRTQLHSAIREDLA